jgi:hypothetical protein
MSFLRRAIIVLILLPVLVEGENASARQHQRQKTNDAKLINLFHALFAPLQLRLSRDFIYRVILEETGERQRELKLFRRNLNANEIKIYRRVSFQQLKNLPLARKSHHFTHRLHQKVSAKRQKMRLKQYGSFQNRFTRYFR